MMDDEYGIDEGLRKKIASEQLAAQGLVGQYQQPVAQSAEHVREFSEDFIMEFDGETGNLTAGSIPKEAKEYYWAINNKNFVWGNFTRLDLRIFDLKKLDIDLADRMYVIHDERYSGNPKHLALAYIKKKRVINQINQDIHTLAKGTRALNGTERKHMVSSYSYAAVDSQDPQKKAGMLRGALASLFGR
jgi:hypothetical protein